mmetsp:Transcript_17819/g.38876  ORF Transcript_17819/g.38876 Transcript_17819/m.38876 type:complete len:238 (+) Transcript_17819:286-999(+)
MSLNMPSYFFRMVFLVERKRSTSLDSAYEKHDFAKPVMESLVLYIAMPTPPDPGNFITSHFSGGLPSAGVNVISNVPALSATKSVARYWSPYAWRPTTMGFCHPGTSRGMFPKTMGSRNTVPLRMLRMVPLGLRHICLSLNSSTRCSSGVMVAHLMPTLSSLMAMAASTVTASSVRSRLGRPRSKYSVFRSTYGSSSLSLISCQITRVISSPSMSTTGFATLIFSGIWEAAAENWAD